MGDVLCVTGLRNCNSGGQSRVKRSTVEENPLSDVQADVGHNLQLGESEKAAEKRSG